jgi:DNA-binding GntR family transcriptional regulator
MTANTNKRTATHPTTVVVQATGKLRAAIMQGDLRPGQKLLEADLSRELNISRPSLREVLRVLAVDRLVELVPNRGPFVAKLGPREVEDIHDVWALLTGEAVFRFAALARPRDIAALKAARQELRDATREKNTLAQLAATNAFFRYIVGRCGNAALTGIVAALVARVNFLRAQSLAVEGWPLACVQEISEILDAIRSNNPRAARAATKRHIASACAAAKQVTDLASHTQSGRGPQFAPQSDAYAHP